MKQELLFRKVQDEVTSTPLAFQLNVLDSLPIKHYADYTVKNDVLYCLTYNDGLFTYIDGGSLNLESSAGGYRRTSAPFNGTVYYGGGLGILYNESGAEILTFSDNIRSLKVVNNKLYLFIRSYGLYTWDGTNKYQVYSYNAVPQDMFVYNDSLYLSDENRLLVMDINENVSDITISHYTPTGIYADSNGVLVGDYDSGNIYSYNHDLSNEQLFYTSGIADARVGNIFYFKEHLLAVVGDASIVDIRIEHLNGTEVSNFIGRMDNLFHGVEYNGKYFIANWSNDEPPLYLE